MNPQERNQVTLESWKEIAAYLQRDAKTARRWEKEEGLPIHRHSHNSRSSVYAYPGEIDAWRVSRKTAVEIPAPPPVSRRPLWRVPAFALTILLCLAMVGNGIRPAEAEQGRLQAKRLLTSRTNTQDLLYYNVSPDGQWLGGTDWSQGDLILTRANSGETKRLVVVNDKDNTRWAETPIISPDQKQIAYWWCDCSGKQTSGQLWVMPNQPGAKGHVLIGTTEEYAGGNGAYPIAWSPDSKRILASLDKPRRNPDGTPAGRTRQIAWVPAADGSAQVIKTFEPFNSGKGVRIALSPDGWFIAYSARVRPDSPEVGITILSSDGSVQTELVRGDVNRDPVWTPDGSHILFASNRSGDFGLWSVAVRDGKRNGVPLLVKPNTGNIRALGITRTGRLIYSNFDDLAQIFIVGVDADTGKARTPATESLVGKWAGWSLDGKWLAFGRPRASPEGTELILHSMETGRDWPTNRNGGFAMWRRDGTLQANIARVRFSVSSGEPKEIEAPVQTPQGALSPDEKLIYTRPNGATDSVEVLDAVTGKSVRTFKVPGGVVFIAVNPDGKSLAIEAVTAGVMHVSRIDVDGSNYQELVSGVTEGQPAWSRDGRSILFAQPEGKNSATVRVMRVSAEGGPAEFTGLSAAGIQDLMLSPDGSKMAYTTRSNDEQIWALDNVLSALK